jgi:hypothetical protein
MGGGLRDGFGPAGTLCLPFARRFEDGENDPSERRQAAGQLMSAHRSGCQGHAGRKGRKRSGLVQSAPDASRSDRPNPSSVSATSESPGVHRWGFCVVSLQHPLSKACESVAHHSFRGIPPRVRAADGKLPLEFRVPSESPHFPAGSHTLSDAFVQR